VTASEQLAELTTLLQHAKEFVAGAFELPEAAMKLDLAPREGDTTRLAKYLQQMSLFHNEAFRRSSQIKSAYLIEGYLQMVDALNPLGIYGFARSLLEFHAFAAHVSAQLQRIATDPARTWRDRGIAFFHFLIRARFGTSSPSKLAILLKDGVPDAHLKPIHVNDCVRHLEKAEDGRYAWIREYYDELCDFVHHNLSSQQAGSVALRTGDRIVSTGGGMVIMKSPGPIVRYEFPATFRGQEAVAGTAHRVLENARGAIDAVNRIRESPFTPEELMTLTGSRFGLPELRPRRRAIRPTARIGRNEPCPCGSGRKWKRCCGK
jgi:hypothetical protein